MNQKVTIFTSVRTKIVISMLLISMLACIVLAAVIMPNIKKNVESTNQNYIEDVARAYGLMFEREIILDGIDVALSYSNLSESLEGVSVDGMESSYVYVVSADGTMLYHPTADKVGQPVENAAVKQTVETISRHETVKNEIIKYEYKGVDKFAGIYVNETQDFIVVVTADSDEIFETMSKVVRMLVIGFILVIIFVIAVGSVIAYHLVKPINQISKLTVRTADMDFTRTEEREKLCARKDETGRMARALDHLISELIDVINEIKENSSSLMDAADGLNTNASETATTMEQVESAINDIAQGATSQANETQQATENVIVMGNMIRDTNEGMNRLISFACSMRETTEHAQEILNDLKTVNSKAEKYIDVIAEQTNTTNESALKISEATKLITSIAEETNLLSLNASIEAARAGEQGRGFGVVAAEIQKLAEQSNESAKRIEEVIQELLLDSEKAVETMYDVKEIIHSQSDHVEQTEIAFGQLTDCMEQSINGLNEISEKTTSLDQARTNVVDIVQSLTAIAEENAAGTEETSASATEVAAIVEDISDKSNSLREVAKLLDEHMNIFKL